MTDDERQSLRVALATTYKAGAELLTIWQAVSPKLVAKVVERQAFGQRLGLLLLGPEDAELMRLQIVLTYGGHIVEVVDVIEYNLTTHILSVRDDGNVA